MIAVMGATGRTGRQICQQLLAAGERVRALGRSERALAELAGLGAETRAGEAADATHLADAFRGASAVFTLQPYDPGVAGYRETQARIGEAVVRALRDARVRRVVAFSSVGADQPSGTGFVASLHAQEQRLRALDGAADLMFLRAGALFENFGAALESIRHDGLVADTVAPEVALPMIATRDVAEAAARALASRDWSGIVVRELLGERDLSYAEATAIIGRRLGRPELRYVQVGDEEMVSTLVQAGYAEDFARLHVELNRAISERRVRSLEGRTPANSTPTRFEEFADALAEAYQTM